MDLATADTSLNLGTALAPPSGAGFQVDVHEEPGGIVLALAGEADIATAPLLAEALAEASELGAARIVLDATSLAFIDASGLGVIASARGVLRGGGRDLVVRSPQSQVRRVLTVVEMDDLIELGEYIERSGR